MFPYNIAFKIPLIIKSTKLKNKVTTLTTTTTDINDCFISVVIGKITLSNSLLAALTYLIIVLTFSMLPLPKIG